MDFNQLGPMDPDNQTVWAAIDTENAGAIGQICKEFTDRGWTVLTAFLDYKPFAVNTRSYRVIAWRKADVVVSSVKES